MSEVEWVGGGKERGEVGKREHIRFLVCEYLRGAQGKESGGWGGGERGGWWGQVHLSTQVHMIKIT